MGLLQQYYQTSGKKNPFSSGSGNAVGLLQQKGFTSFSQASNALKTNVKKTTPSSRVNQSQQQKPNQSMNWLDQIKNFFIKVTNPFPEPTVPQVNQRVGMLDFSQPQQTPSAQMRTTRSSLNNAKNEIEQTNKVIMPIARVTNTAKQDIEYATGKAAKYGNQASDSVINQVNKHPKLKKAIISTWDNFYNNLLLNPAEQVILNTRALEKLPQGNPFTQFEKWDIRSKQELGKGIIQGVARSTLNWNDRVSKALDTEVKGAEKRGFKDVNTVGQLIGQIASYVGGGEVLGATKLAKVGIPLAFTTLGQTSLPSDTPGNVRVKHSLIDTTAGTVFSFLNVPANVLSLKNLGLKSTELATLTAQVYGDARASGATHKQAMDMVKDSLILNGGIIAAFAGLKVGQLTGEKLLNSKIKTGEGVFTPQEARRTVLDAGLQDTPGGQHIFHTSILAEDQGKNVKISGIAAKKSKVAEVVNANTPHGVRFSAEVVDAPAQVGEVVPPTEQAKETIPTEPTAPAETKQITTSDLNLPTDIRSEEKPAFDELTKNPQALVDKYIKQYGNLIGADEAKTIFKGYTKQTADNFHRASTIIRDQVYNKLLTDTQGTGKNVVDFTAGGTGAGKSEAVEYAKKNESTAIIYDSTFSHLPTAEKVINQALDHDKKVEIYYISTDPVVAWERVLSRGRKLAAENHINYHVNSLENIKALYNKYKDSQNIVFKFFDNSGDVGHAKVMSFDEVAKLVYNKEELRSKIHEPKSTENTTNQNKGRTGETRRPAGQGNAKEPQQSNGGKVRTSPKETSTGAIVPKEIADYLKDKFGKTKEKANKTEVSKALEENEGKIIPYSPKNDILKKISSPLKGYSNPISDYRPALFYGGVKKGIFTDGYLLLLDHEAAHAVNDAIQTQETQAEIKDLMSSNPELTHAKAEKLAKERIQEKIDDPENIEKYPNIDRVIPKDIGNKAYIQGYANYNRTNTVILSDGKEQTTLDANRFALMKKLLPDTEIHIQGYTKPVVFTRNGKVEGLLMPMRVEGKDIGIKPSVNIPEDVSIEKPKRKPTKQPTGNFSLKQAVDSSIVPAKTPEELKKRIDQLNKFAQANAILRRTGGITRKQAVGQFVQPGKAKMAKGVAKEGQVRLKGKYITNEADYMSTLAHELGHAIEYNVTGKNNAPNFKIFGDDLDTETVKTLHQELKAITEQLEGKDTVAGNPFYYSQPAELIARFFEKMMVIPGDLEEIAPTASRLIDLQSIKHPMIREFMEAINNEIDKGVPKLQFLSDMRQTYQKYLGKRVGNIAYDEEIAHRAMQERAKIVIEKFIKSKFKGVKDDPALLFRVAESIKITEGGKPEFGTRDFALAKTDTEETELQEAGFKKVDTQVEDGKLYPLYARQRYTKAEGQALFDELSPQGKELVKDFTTARDEAKDYFNREIIKDVNKINGNVEGWVHHYFENTPTTGINKGLRFREKMAGGRKHRTGKEGYVEDFQKAMTKVLVDLEGEKVYNDFITRQFARVTKPIPEGQSPEPGWVEVVGDVKKGVGTRQEKKIIVVEDGKKFIPKSARYQMPKPIYERYRMWKGLVDEASSAVKIVSNINRYWRINVLAHPGTSTTNFISGGLQYSTKVLTDFYTETLTGKVGYAKTRHDIAAILQTLLPKGWSDAPDWVYGGDLSNWYGQYMTKQGKATGAINSYGNKALALFGAYERYWKKVIALSENVSNLKDLEKVGKEGLRLPTAQERDLIAYINREIDLFAYDYDNVPMWLETHQKSPVGQAIKPFAKYPYKYAKQITNMVGSVFDRSIPWQERVAKLLAIGTLIGLYAYISSERKKKQQTPEGSTQTPARLSPRGRLFITQDKNGKDIFIRTAKYPFLNLTDMGQALLKGDFESARQQITDMIGSIGTAGEIGLTLMGYKNEYNTYAPTQVVLAQDVASYVTGFRVLSDISRMLDPYQRKQTSVFQAFTSNIPVTSPELQQKLHGDIRTVKVPIEGDIKKPEGEGTKRTTVDRVLKNYWQDILIGLLSGVYVTRIDPKEANAFQIRSEKNQEKKSNPKKKQKTSNNSSNPFIKSP